MSGLSLGAALIQYLPVLTQMLTAANNVLEIFIRANREGRDTLTSDELAMIDGMVADSEKTFADAVEQAKANLTTANSLGG